MIDTIAIMLEPHQFNIADHGKFSPNSRNLFESPYYPMQNGRVVCTQNPSAIDRKAGIYKPRLTLTKRVIKAGLFATTLKIEFSIPKLFHGNNFIEVSNQDFIEIIALLNACLKDMGVDIYDPYSTLPNALVSTIHYSKNFILHSHISCTMILHELSKADISQTLDSLKTDYSNGGHSYRLHANSFEIIWYDKIKDLEKSRVSEKRAIENDTYCQLDIFEDKFLPKQMQVFRMETRLGNRTKIRDVLKRIGFNQEPTFEKLFNSFVSQKVLLHYWQKINNSVVFPSLKISSHIKGFTGLMKRNPNLKPNKALQLLAALVLIEEVGIRAFRNNYCLHGNSKAWTRLKKDFKDLNLSELKGFIASEQISTGLNEFTPIKYKDVKYKDVK